MQLGFVGLGKMGGNMVHRIHRDSDHQVVAFDFSEDAVETAEGHGATGAGSLEDLVSKLEAPRTVWVMVPAGDPTEETVKKLGELLDEGDTIVDGGNTNWHDDVRRASELDAIGIHYIDVGTSGGVWGLEVGYCMMVGGHEESVRAARADPRHARPARRLAPLRRRGRGPLREDGPQRRGVRDHAGLRRGLRPDARSRASRSTSRRSRGSGTAARSCARGCASWPSARSTRRATTSRASAATSRTPARAAGRSSTRSTTTCPAPVITAALYARFYSRGNGDYTNRVLAALRNQFGGHAVERASGGG